MNSSNSDDEMDVQDLEVIDVTFTSKPLKGSFVSAAHPTSGMTTVSTDFMELNFKNFKTDDGPKLLV